VRGWCLPSGDDFGGQHRDKCGGHDDVELLQPAQNRKMQRKRSQDGAFRRPRRAISKGPAPVAAGEERDEGRRRQQSERAEEVMALSRAAPPVIVEATSAGILATTSSLCSFSVIWGLSLTR
jgi:hypothetical protein